MTELISEAQSVKEGSPDTAYVIAEQQIGVARPQRVDTSTGPAPLRGETAC